MGAEGVPSNFAGQMIHPFRVIAERVARRGSARPGLGSDPA